MLRDVELSQSSSKNTLYQHTQEKPAFHIFCSFLLCFFILDFSYFSLNLCVRACLYLQVYRGHHFIIDS